MLTHLFSVSILTLLAAGCAAQPPPLVNGPDHPASPDAAEAPLPPPSDTLAADQPRGLSPAAGSTDGMHHPAGATGNDMKGMNMNQGDQSMPGMQHGRLNGGHE